MSLIFLQFEAPGIHLRACRVFADGAAAHDPEPWFSSHKLFAAKVITRAFNPSSTVVVSSADQVSCNMLSERQQRTSAEARKLLAIPARCPEYWFWTRLCSLAGDDGRLNGNYGSNINDPSSFSPSVAGSHSLQSRAVDLHARVCSNEIILVLGNGVSCWHADLLQRASD